MAIIKWSPMGDIDRFFDEDFFPTIFERTMPALDIRQTEKEVIVEASVAGIDPEKVDISIEGDVLTIKGESEKKEEVKQENYFRKEIHKGSFHRSVMLPVAVKGDAASAEFKNGILRILIPKEEKAMPKKIAVKVTK